MTLVMGRERDGAQSTNDLLHLSVDFASTFVGRGQFERKLGKLFRLVRFAELLIRLDNARNVALKLGVQLVAFEMVFQRLFVSGGWRFCKDSSWKTSWKLEFELNLYIEDLKIIWNFVWKWYLRRKFEKLKVWELNWFFFWKKFEW